MARLEIHLFGPLDVYLDAQPVSGFQSVKVQALLAYLAAEASRPQRRDTLAGLLWPDWPQSAAIKNLRQALYDLRRNIYDNEETVFLHITRGSLQFNQESDCWIDVKAFEQATGEDGRQSTGDSSATAVSRLRSAVESYRGDFLEGFSLSDSPEFETWILSKRQYYNQKMLEVLGKLAAHHEQNGDFDQALAYARRQLKLEPWLESTHYQVMRLLALSSRRSEALAQYEQCRQILKSELDTEPSAATRRLYQSILSEDLEVEENFPENRNLSEDDSPPEPGKSPFKGLQYFDLADANLFFGREILTSRLVDHLRKVITFQTEVAETEAHAFLAVVGASGSGKSSVVRAGLVPRLMRGEHFSDSTLPPENYQDWDIHVFTPTAHPIESMAVNLTRDAESLTEATKLMDDLHNEPRSLRVFAQRNVAAKTLKNARLLLVIDQFEELFTLCRSEAERDAFLDNLMNACRDKGPAIIIIVLRADFYSHCAQHSGLRQMLSSQQEYIGAMDIHELRRAIEQPAVQNGWTFEDGLVDLILRDVGAGEDHPPEPGALPLLGHALLETWRCRSGRVLTLKGYVETGGVHGAIAKTADRFFAELDPEQQILAQRIFLRLTELGEGTQDTRRRVQVTELTSGSKEVEILLHNLADARLITLSEDTAEVAHEALIREWPALRQWLDEDREGLKLQRHLTESAQAWQAMGKVPGELYRGARLARVQEWVDLAENAEALNELEHAFLLASQAQVEEEAARQEARRQRELEAALELAQTQRQQRTWALVTVLLASAIVLIIAVIIIRSTNAKLEQANAASTMAAEQARSNQASNLILQSQLHQNENFDLALLLASEAVSLIPSAEAQSNLLSLLNSNPRLRAYRNLHDSSGGIYDPISGISGPVSDIFDLQFSPNGRILAVGESGIGISLWDISNPNNPILYENSTIESSEENFHTSISQDNHLILTRDRQGIISIWDISNPSAPNFLGPFPNSSSIRALIFSQGENKLVGFDESGLVTWEINSLGAVEFHSRVPFPFTLIWETVMGQSDRFFAAAEGDCTISLWDVSDIDSPFLLGQHKGIGVSIAQDLMMINSGQKMIAAPCSGNAFLLDFSDPSDIQKIGKPITYNNEWIDGVDLNVRGDLLVGKLSGSFSNLVLLWDVSDPENPILLGNPLKGHRLSVTNIDFSPDGKIFVTGSDDGKFVVWDGSRTPRADRIVKDILDSSYQVVDFVFSSDSKMLATRTEDGKILLWDMENPGTPNQVGPRLEGCYGLNKTLSFDPESHYLAAGCVDGSVLLWDMANLESPNQITDSPAGCNGSVYSLVFAPDRSYLAFGCEDGLIHLWDIREDKPSQIGQPFESNFWKHEITSLIFNSNGHMLVSGGQDTYMEFWDLSDPGQLKLLGELFVGCTGTIFDLLFDTDGTTLAVGCGEKEIRFVDVSDPTKPTAVGQPLINQNLTASSLAYRPEDQILLAHYPDNTIILWDIRDKDHPVPRDFPKINLPEDVEQITLGPGGKWLITRRKDHSIAYWDLDIESWQRKTCEISGRNLTQEEWEQYFPGAPYRKTCSQWP